MEIGRGEGLRRATQHEEFRLEGRPPRRRGTCLVAVGELVLRTANTEEDGMGVNFVASRQLGDALCFEPWSARAASENILRRVAAWQGPGFVWFAECS